MLGEGFKTPTCRCPLPDALVNALSRWRALFAGTPGERAAARLPGPCFLLDHGSLSLLNRARSLHILQCCCVECCSDPRYHDFLPGE